MVARQGETGDKWFISLFLLIDILPEYKERIEQTSAMVGLC
jgi:hypothetical protein